MFVVAVYDVVSERNPRVLRHCRKFLHHVQNSVFEGRLSEAQLREFRGGLSQVLGEGDRVALYLVPSASSVERVLLGEQAVSGDTVI